MLFVGKRISFNKLYNKVMFENQSTINIGYIPNIKRKLKNMSHTHTHTHNNLSINCW
jgi:hypothetical protein